MSIQKIITIEGLHNGRYSEIGTLTDLQAPYETTGDYSLYINPDYGNDNHDGAGTTKITGTTLICGTASSATYTDWVAITDGSFGTVIDGTYYDITAIDFTGDTSMADVASTIQTAVQTATGGAETVAWSTDHFVFTVGTSISVLTTARASIGTNISGANETLTLWINGSLGGLNVLTCGTASSATYTDWVAITDGSFGTVIDGTYYDITAIDFTGDTSMADVASTIQTAVQTATGGAETVAWDTDHFVFTAASTISILKQATNTVGTDISGLGSTVWINGAKACVATWDAIKAKIPSIVNNLIYIVCTASVNYNNLGNWEGYAGAGDVQIYGDPSTPTNCTVTRTGTGSCMNISNTNLNFSLYGFALIGDDNVNSTGIYCDNSTSVYLNNVVIQDFGKGLDFRNNAYVKYEDCDITSCAVAGLYALDSTISEISTKSTADNVIAYQMLNSVVRRSGLDPLTPGIEGTTLFDFNGDSRVYDESGEVYFEDTSKSIKKRMVSVADDGVVALGNAGDIGTGIIIDDSGSFAEFLRNSDDSFTLKKCTDNFVDSNIDGYHTLTSGGYKNRTGGVVNIYVSFDAVTY